MHKDEMWQTYAPNGEAIPGEGWDSALGNPEKSGSDNSKQYAKPPLQRDDITFINLDDWMRMRGMVHGNI
ncbi:hypothetical protein IKE99_02305 [Candidatus Saccharibacteria bacterium]|nr:hypothetical protein [Candidatus Saccharibacteria bacterium]